MRKPIVAGNWKLHGSKAFVDELLSGLQTELAKAPQALPDIIVCPPAIYIAQASSAVQGAAIPVSVGGQNAAQHEKGAYTGEIAPGFLKDTGCSYVILGHSERRELFGETDAVIADKVALALESDLTPILCVGETLQQREAGETLHVVTTQLQAVVERVGIQAFARLVIAYEPVWAIGTGVTATPEQAQDVHQRIRAYLADQDATVAAGIRILYGGSVKPENAATLFAAADIDGGLIGGASLNVSDFVAICRAAAG